MRLLPLAVGAIAATLTATALSASPAQALDTVNTAKFRKAVTVGGILAHERVFQRIANQNGGTRSSGTPGFAASAKYVKQQLKSYGYTVKEQKFTFDYWTDVSDPALAQVSPTPADYEVVSMTYSGAGDVTGTVVPAGGTVVPATPDPSSASGCAAGDFTPASATEDQVALIQRGSCDFAVKARNAEAAGYDAALIFNEGNANFPDRQGELNGTLGELGVGISIPVLGLNYDDGAALYTAAQAGPVTVDVVSDTKTIPGAQTSNIIADSPTGNANNVIVVGAHLDSVPAGPGINDNGSGSATNLEIAKQLTKLKIKTKQKVRFAFWGAEEFSLLGSQYYVDNISDANLARIKANLNFDMLGSPNYARFVYDGDGSEDGSDTPAGSGEIESVFTDYFDGQNLASSPTAFDGRSDYGPFIAVGIPAGGLFSGAEGIKTEDEADTYGGTAGDPYDSCYHQACDDINNLSTAALDELGDAAAHAVLTLAVSKTGLQVDGSFRTAKKAPGSAQYEGHTAVS